MEEKHYFVILNCQNGMVTPMVQGDLQEELAMFEHEYEAIAAAENNMLGANFGFEVFELGGGTCCR